MAVRTSAVTIYYRKRSSPSATWPTTYQSRTFSSREEMVSINHMPINYDGDDGGPWLLDRSNDKPQVGNFIGTAPNNLLFDGQFVVTKPPGYVLKYGRGTKLSDSSLDSFGTSAIAKVAPTNPAFEFSTAFGEVVREGIPMVTGSTLLKERVKAARSAGSEYLNVEFGWKPLVREIQSFARTVKDSDTILRQYRKDSDIKIRRAYDGKPEQASSLYQSDQMYTDPAQFSGSGYVSETFLRKQWFRGAFKYHIPVADDTLGKFQNWVSMSNHLLGWKVTPETVWNLAPWSWAVDWFTSTGDVLANISNLGTDGLVMQYGYSMAQASHLVKYVGTFYARYGQSAHLTRDLSYEWKQRRPATPFGFGIDLSTLSHRQIAIMVALGLSRT